MKRERLPIMSTFGFGNAVDTPMLINIANEGRGMHCFIPDSSFVGTAFVNLLSNLMVCYTFYLLSCTLTFLGIIRSQGEFNRDP